VRNEKVLQRVKEQRNILRTTKRRNTNLIGYTLRRDSLSKHILDGKIEGEMEVTGR
jgi:hypothetical protein